MKRYKTVLLCQVAKLSAFNVLAIEE